MIRKQEATGKTVDEARAKACALLGVQADDLNVSYEVLEMPQKTGFLGLKLTPAKVCVSVEEPDAPAATPAPAAEEKAPVQPVKEEQAVIEPASGYLACGDTGAGKMPEPEMLLDYILREIAKEKDLLGRKVLVTAGPTQESIDPVRYITNHSSGKMGYALAKAAMLRGADVTLVSGPCAIEPPPFVKLVPVVTAKEMFDAVTSVSFEQDIIIKAAAVADYRPANVYEDKVKKQEEQMSIELEKTDDILGYLGEHRLPGQFLCGFSMETQNMIGNSRAKLGKKHLDMVAANNLKVAGAGFQGDTNVLTLITQDEDVSLQLMSKEDAANVILDKILSIQKEREKQ